MSTPRNVAELEPVFLNGATDNRTGVGIDLNCPCGCPERLYVPFANPLDGGPQYGQSGWQRTGDTFETLTLRPSIHRINGCTNSWHGYITEGKAHL